MTQVPLPLAMVTAPPRSRLNPAFDELPSLWRAAPTRWGHELHSLCSYLAMFPPSIPRVFISWLTDEGDTVYDPFSGRGTTALEACLLGRVGLGSDLNPMAVLLTQAKVDPPSLRALDRRLSDLRRRIRRRSTRSEPERIRMLFSERTLGEIVWLKDELSRSSKVDRFLLAVLLGILHLNADQSGRPRGLTVAMPNTFAMAPGYVARYIRDKDLAPPDVSVVSMLESRVARLANSLALPVRGRGFRHDATTRPSLPTKAKLIFTSPPYLHVVKYGKFNWIRLWLLDEEPREVDEALFTSSSLAKYKGFMSSCLASWRAALRDDGYMCLVVGDVRTPHASINLAAEIVDHCLDGLDLVSLGVVDDFLPVHQKVTRIWGPGQGSATKVDRIIVLAGPKATLNRPIPNLIWRDES